MVFSTEFNIKVRYDYLIDIIKALDFAKDSIDRHDFNDYEELVVQRGLILKLIRILFESIFESLEEKIKNSKNEFEHSYFQELKLCFVKLKT